jgi:ApaG protein
MNTISDCTTEGIRVTVTPEFVQEENNPDGKKFLFSYRVDIKNEGKSWAKLMARHWEIINADGEKQVVDGGGVVGYFPELAANTSFTYTSYCPIDTKWGTMEGYFEMMRDDGNLFLVKIERLYLISPKLNVDKE